MLGAFSVVTGDNRSPVIIHVPHAGLRIPRSELPSFVLSPADLKAEARRMADLDTHELAFQVRDRSGYRPWLFQNEMSRLVMDPERFPDDSEIMNQVGMGVVYTRTSDRQVLRRPDRVRSRSRRRRARESSRGHPPTPSASSAGRWVPTRPSTTAARICAKP